MNIKLSDKKTFQEPKRETPDEYAKRIAEEEKEKEAKRFEEARQKLYDAAIDEMSHNALDLEISEKSIQDANKKIASIKRKKVAFLIGLITLFGVISICGIYNTFFKHEYTGPEIAALANYYNVKTNFPEAGVQGYLENNIETLLVDKVTYSKDIAKVNYGTPVVTRINAKNNLIANVYFYLPVSTSMESDGTSMEVTSDDELVCMIPIYFDSSVNKYYPCGDIILTPLGTTYDSTNKVSNPLMSFEGISALGDNETQSAYTFVDNFFKMFYEGQDVSVYYTGKELFNRNLKYNGMDEFRIYSENNQGGYNCVCTVSLTSTTGLTFTTEKYLTVNRVDTNNWTIANVL